MRSEAVLALAIACSGAVLIASAIGFLMAYDWIDDWLKARRLGTDVGGTIYRAPLSQAQKVERSP